MENKKEKNSEILASWEFAELPTYKRSRLWYVIAAIIFISLIIYSYAADDLLFALVLILFVFIILYSYNQSGKVKFTITLDGIALGNKFYPYRDIEKFWIIYRPPTIKKIFFGLKGFLKLNLVIPLEKENPVVIRRILLKYLVEDLSQEDEPFSDKISRAIKL